MKDFEEILETLIPDGVKFGWGHQDDLPRFIAVYGEKHFPFIWSIPKEDRQSGHGDFERDVELNICTRETRDLLNPVRLNADKSYKSILYPAWEALANNIDRSHNMTIIKDSISFKKFPEFSDSKFEAPEIWDVLKVKFKAKFNNDYAC